MKCCHLNAALQVMFLPLGEVSETTVEVGSSANTWEFMSSAYFKNCSININVTDYPNVNEHKEGNLYSYCSVGFGDSVLALQ